MNDSCLETGSLGNRAIGDINNHDENAVLETPVGVLSGLVYGTLTVVPGLAAEKGLAADVVVGGVGESETVTEKPEEENCNQTVDLDLVENEVRVLFAN